MSGQIKWLNSDPLFKESNLCVCLVWFFFLPGETWNLLCSLCPFSTSLLLLKWTHLALKPEHRSWNAAQLNPPTVSLDEKFPSAWIFSRLCHPRRDSSWSGLASQQWEGAAASSLLSVSEAARTPNLVLFHSQKDTKWPTWALPPGHQTFAPCQEDHGDTHLSRGIYHNAKSSQNQAGGWAMFFVCPEMGSKGVLGQPLSLLIPVGSSHKHWCLPWGFVLKRRRKSCSCKGKCLSPGNTSTVNKKQWKMKQREGSLAWPEGF